MFMGRVLRVMVCSPSDVSAERAEIVKAIHELTADILIEEDVVLVPVLWEDMLPSTMEGVDGQTSINEMMTHKADIFIGVFKHRFGVQARAGVDADVGTVEEIMIAMKAKKPLHLFFYTGADRIDQNNAGQVGQLAKVHEFKSSMQEHGIYAPYLNEYELKGNVSRVITANVRKFIRENPLPSKVPARIVDKPSDTPPVSGSKIVHTSSTNPVVPKGLPKLVTGRRLNPGIPTRPPVKAVDARPAPRKSDDDHEKLSREQLHDYERAYNKDFTEDDFHLTPKELHERANREMDRKQRARIDGQSVLGHPAPKAGVSEVELEREMAKVKNSETRHPELFPVIEISGGQLNVSFNGNPTIKMENLRISIRDLSNHGIESKVKTIREFAVGEKVSLPLELSKTRFRNSLIELIWTVNGAEFSTRQRNN